MAFAICCVSKTAARDYIDSFKLLNASHSDEASLLFWNWLLDYTRLSAKNAALHDVFQDGSTAVFYDLDDDGIREIIGTHYCTDILSCGSCYLYILKYDESEKSNYKIISGDLTFDIHKTLYILNDKSGGYHNIRAKSRRSGRNKIFVFDAERNFYIQK